MTLLAALNVCHHMKLQQHTNYPPTVVDAWVSLEHRAHSKFAPRRAVHNILDSFALFGQQGINIKHIVPLTLLPPSIRV
jgi:hypothetical protein